MRAPFVLRKGLVGEGFGVLDGVLGGDLDVVVRLGFGWVGEVVDFYVSEFFAGAFEEVFAGRASLRR